MNRSGIDRTVALGVITTVLVTVVVGITFSGSAGNLLGKSGDTTIRAAFASTGQLRPGDEVRIHGIKVGEVDSMDSAGDRQSTLVTMKVDSDKAKLYRDARASVRWRTILGAAFYVALDSGSSTSGDLGGETIPTKRTTAQVELDDITSVVRGGAQTGLQRLPGELATALEGKTEATETLDTLQSLSPQVERVANALRGQDQDRDLRRLVHGTARTVAVLGRHEGELRRLVEDAAGTLQTTAANEQSVRATLELSPAMMRNTNVTLTRLRHTLDLADPVVDGVDKVAARVGPTLSSLRPTVVGADRLLRRARPLLRDLRPTVNSLAGLARRGLPMLNELTPTITRVEKTIIPGISRKWPETGISTTVMIGAALAGLGGIAGQKDANGHFVRFPLTGGSGTVALPCQAFPNNPDLTPQQQVACQSLDKTLGQILSYQPLRPAPGAEGTPPPSVRRSK